MAAAVAVKTLIGLYTLKRGKRLASAALKASGKDSVNDAGATALALAAGVIYMSAGVSVEAYVGILISVFILKTGIETLRETVSSLLGERVDTQLASAIKRSILSFPEVDDVFDISIHNYGRQKLIGSVHIEVPDVLKTAWIDNLQRAITEKVLAETGDEMLGITIYAVNSRDREAIRMREEIRKRTEEYDRIKGLHGFYLNKVDNEVSFTVETDYDASDPGELHAALTQRILRDYPEYKVNLRISYSLE